jgi:hypothetical protein
VAIEQNQLKVKEISQLNVDLQDFQRTNKMQQTLLDKTKFELTDYKKKNDALHSELQSYKILSSPERISRKIKEHSKE